MSLSIRRLDYQERVLAALDGWLDALGEEKVKADRIAELAAEQPDLGLDVPDFPARAWEKLAAAGRLPASRAGIAWSPRTDGAGRPVPNAVLKVPTGGGKTFVALDAVSRVFGRYLGKNTGFVLWIVPNEAIYTQTLKRLKDRQDPYRQMLDRAAAGKVRILEKTDTLHARDVEAHLCVMLLMLQSANRQTQDTLKMFRDRGDVHGFTPPEAEQDKHAGLLRRIPNLDVYDLADGQAQWATVKDSLGNALRIIRPVVVMDEGHRAISDLAFSTLYGFNPALVLELTATPKDVQPRSGANRREGRAANVLVEVTGRELDREGMIKMPLNLETRQDTDWKATLNAALDRLNTLDAAAGRLRADTGRYIRPILLVQVERTGADTRDAGHIHAEDARDWLRTAGLDDAEIAVKTADTNDLAQPENQDLMARTNRVRVIITKQALQEGWDCPFAYVLCALAASSNLNAMTQLVGRILRQPGAMKTGVPALDEGYVITHHAGTAEVVKAIKDGLEKDGLGDLVLAVSSPEAGAIAGSARKVRRRETFSKTDIYLPKVLRVTDGQARDLDYETDILAALDWRGFDPAAIADRIPENAQAPESQMKRIHLTDTGDERILDETLETETGDLAEFDPAQAARLVSDLIPNAFVGREIVGRLVARLAGRGFSAARIGALSGLVIEELRRGLDDERARRAEAFFRAEVEASRIQFRLRADGRNWRMPFEVETGEPENAPKLLNANGDALERSLFAPVYQNELNRDEQDVAVYLDGEGALRWWHRNVARQQYGLQGWRRAKIYPDFIFAVQRDGAGDRLMVLETKGDQLDNLDTAYKRDVLKVMSDSFAWERTLPAGELELVSGDQTVECALVLMSDWKTVLPGHLA